ncbi:MAG: heavy metal-binding domain-containing protein [Ignavibacteriaceae bacterium]
MTQLIKIFAVLLFIAFVSVSIAQEKSGMDKKECSGKCCSGDKSHGTMQMTYMDSDSTNSNHQEMKSDSKMHGMHHNMNMKSDSTETSSIVREGEIDLQSIDKNKDGKVFQDMMDWNVISDETGKCPLCGMKLKEVSLDKAKENLLKHDFEVKEDK